MKVNQVYKVLNSVGEQIYGESYVKVTDLQGLISLGNDVLSSDSTKEPFLNTLVDRIGKTIISQRAYSADVASLLNDSFTFGAILQKIYISPVKAKKSDQWDLADGKSVDQYVITKPEVKQKLFSVRNTWSVNITIPDIQFSSAFTSETEMAAFIDAIFLSIRNSQEIYLAGMAEMCYANMIGEQVVNTNKGKKASVINLLSQYNTLMNKNLTTSQALHDLEFLKYASMTINLYVKKMGKMSTIFNAEGFARFTPTDKMRIIMLTDFTSACTSYLQSNTYHDELVALPQYKEVSYWQGLGDKIDFDQCSKVSIVTSSGSTVIQPNVVCMLTDEEAIGLTYDNRRSKSAYNALGEYTNYSEKADMGYFNDLSENCIVFTIGDVSKSTTSQVTPIENAEITDGAVETLTLAAGETVSSIKCGSDTLVATTDYTITGAQLAIKAATVTKYVPVAGDTAVFDIALSTGAHLEFILENPEV